VVDIEHGALGSLEEHRLVLVQELPGQAGGIGDVLLQAVPVGQVLLGHGMQVQRRVALEGSQRQALGLQGGGDLLLQDLLVEQVLDSNAQPRRLVGVAGPDAAPRGPDLQASQAGLARGVQQQVVGHDQVGVGRDPQAAHVDPPSPQAVDLLGQHLGVDDDAVADHARLARVEDPRRDQVELPLDALAHDRVAGVVAALEADDRVRPLGEQVGDLPLALIAPLGADYDDPRHARGSLRGAGPGGAQSSWPGDDGAAGLRSAAGR